MPGSHVGEVSEAHSNGTNSSLNQKNESSQTPAAIAAYIERLKSLTNYEVWTEVEAAIQTMTPSTETGLQDWGRFRALLDELRWRLSGIEGAGSTSNQVLTIEETIKPH
jgi:catalase (peroxidase I)